MDDPDAVPTLEQPKTENSFNLFDKLNCVRAARPPLRHEYGRDHDDESIEQKLERLDEDKMMAHILDCVGAVCEAQRARVAWNKPLKLSQDGEALTAEQQAARNKVFKAALATMVDGLTHDGMAAGSGYVGNTAARMLTYAFPEDDNYKMKDGRGWLPLHWAVVAASAAAGEEHGVTEADVEVVYGLDPAALCRHHLDGPKYRYRDMYGFTPAHLLVMQETTERTRALVRYFTICRPASFTMNVSYFNEEDSDDGNDYPSIQRDVFGALNVACRYGQPTESLLQQLVQLDSSACRGCPARIEWTPLGALCLYNERIDERLLRCLLAADSSTEVVVDGIRGCCRASKRAMSRVAAVKLLLEANPAAARHEDSDGWTLAHGACFSDDIQADEIIGILQLLMAAHKDAFEVFGHGKLPIHLLASQGPVEALEYLLDACPETVASVTTDSELAPSTGKNLLHCVVEPYSSCAPGCTLTMARLLCSRYPAMMLQRDSRGQTPLYLACYNYRLYDNSASPASILALCEAGGREVVSAPVVVPVVADDDNNDDDDDDDDDDDGDDDDGDRVINEDEGWLPLHKFVSCWYVVPNKDSLLSPWADTFRLLLRLYPEAAGTEGGRDDRLTTPYGLAVKGRLPAYYRRLLLRAAPHLDPAELRRLNWEERRPAMFLAFTAFGGKPPLLARLRYENVDLVKHVVSFL